MKVFSLLKQQLSSNPHPQEDYFVISKKYPIFVVADGVSLDFDDASNYPSPSGAGEAAKIFCEAVISEAEKRYESFEEKDIKDVFDVGDKAVLEYNISKGRTKDTINYYDVDLFSATTAFVLVKEDKLYWWSLCDSGVKIFNNNSEKIFSSPGGWINFPKSWIEKQGDKKKIISRHKDYRNAVGKRGELKGYGVADGEEAAKFYLNTGVLNINAGNLIFLYTDGFESYFDSEEFINLFKLWPRDIEKPLEHIISEKSKINPSKFGREKTIIAISI